MTDPYIILPGSIILLSIGAIAGRITSGAAKLRAGLADSDHAALALAALAEINEETIREQGRRIADLIADNFKLRAAKQRRLRQCREAAAKGRASQAAKRDSERHKRIKASEDKFSLTPLAGHEIEPA